MGGMGIEEHVNGQGLSAVLRTAPAWVADAEGSVGAP